MSLSLTDLAAFAATNNNKRPASKAVHTLSVEDAREAVIILDGNKKTAEDGSQALTLKLGKYVMELDAIAPKATRINATAEQVEEFTALLQTAIDDGTLDASIAAAQDKSLATFEKGRAKPAPAANVDLDALDAEVDETVEADDEL